MITLTFPWWAGVLVLFFWAAAGSLGEQAGDRLGRAASRWRAKRRDRHDGS